MLPAGVVSDLERDRIVDAAAGCLSWTQFILDSLQDLPDISPEVVECAQAAAPSVETDRLAADIMLFGGEFMTVLNLVLPPDCLPQTGGSQADTPAGRLTAAQLMLAGVSPESAACVAEQVDALGGMPSGESDTDSATAAEQATAMMLGCLTPEEMALLSGSQADTPAGRLTASTSTTTTTTSPLPLTTAAVMNVTAPGEYAGEVLVIHVAFESRVADVTTAEFEATAIAILTDPGGWVQSGFVFVADPDSGLRVVLAEGPEVDELCLPLDTSGRVSCQNGSVVALNADRWRAAFHDWDSTVEAYRVYVVTHEVGHLIGLRHPADRCPEGEPVSAVMEPQTNNLVSCAGNGTPLPWEIEWAKNRPAVDLFDTPTTTRSDNPRRRGSMSTSLSTSP